MSGTSAMPACWERALVFVAAAGQTGDYSQLMLLQQPAYGMPHTSRAQYRNSVDSHPKNSLNH